MRSWSELIAPGDSVLREVRRLTALSKDAEILLASETHAAEIESLQITTGSMLGTLAYYTGGIVIDSGWLRILGSGHPRCPWSVAKAGGILGWSPTDTPSTAIVAAVDVLGGLYAVNGGGISDRSIGRVHYLDPTRLVWSDLAVGHGDWVRWALDDHERSDFYRDLRWDGWEVETRRLSASEGFHFYPPLWTAESRPLHLASKRAVLIDEIVRLSIEAANRLG